MSHLNGANPQEGVSRSSPARVALPFLVSTKLAPVPPATRKAVMRRPGLLRPYGFICVPLAQLYSYSNQHKFLVLLSPLKRDRNVKIEARRFVSQD